MTNFKKQQDQRKTYQQIVRRGQSDRITELEAELKAKDARIAELEDALITAFGNWDDLIHHGSTLTTKGHEELLAEVEKVLVGEVK